MNIIRRIVGWMGCRNTKDNAKDDTDAVTQVAINRLIQQVKMLAMLRRQSNQVLIVLAFETFGREISSCSLGDSVLDELCRRVEPNWFHNEDSSAERRAALIVAWAKEQGCMVR